MTRMPQIGRTRTAAAFAAAAALHADAGLLLATLLLSRP